MSFMSFYKNKEPNNTRQEKWYLITITLDAEIHY